MPVSVYKLMFPYPDCKKIASSKLETGTYTTYIVKLVGSCVFYLVHPDTKCLQEVAFCVASNNGSVLLSYVTTLAPGMIQPHTRFYYLPPRASLITSSADHPKKTKSQISVHVSKKSLKCLQCPTTKEWYPSSLQARNTFLPIIQIFYGIGCFPGPLYHIKADPSVTPKENPCQPIPVHLKESFKKEIDKMLQARVLKPVHQTTPWINSFVLVEGKDKLRNLENLS